MNKSFTLCCLAAALGGCSGMSPMSSENRSSMSTAAPMDKQDSLPAAVRVPPGNRIAMETVGVGEITYQCRTKQGSSTAYEWVFAGPKAKLSARNGTPVGSYYGPPATWESMDGSKITGSQVAVAPGGSGNIPFQLVKAEPAMGNGVMTGVTYVQRLATVGGVAPMLPCGSGNAGENRIVQYQADYIFWSAMDRERLQKSSEMMIPPLLVPTVLGPSRPMPAATVSPQDEDDRRAAELMRRTDMMMPEMAQSRGSRDPHALTAMPGIQRPTTPISADDRRAAESILRTDQMRPD